MTLFPSLVDPNKMSKKQKLSLFIAAIPVVLVFQFAVQLYRV